MGLLSDLPMFSKSPNPMGRQLLCNAKLNRDGANLQGLQRSLRLFVAGFIMLFVSQLLILHS